MVKGTMNWSNFIVTMLLLYVGAILGNFVTPMLPVSLGGWGEGLFVALVQVILLMVVGVISGKMGLWDIVISVMLLFIGGLVGGFVASWLGISGMYAVILILAIQTFALLVIKTSKLGNKLR